MKIGFIAEPYEESGASGMGYLILELMRNLPVVGKEHDFTIYSSKPIRKDLVSVPVRNIIIPPSLLGKLFWFMTTREDIDVLLFVTPLLPLWLPKRIKTVVICPELGSQKITPGTFMGKFIAFVRDQILMPVCLARAIKIISISQATKEDIRTYYHIPNDKIEVIYIAFQDLSNYALRAPDLPKEQKPFFFFTGRVKPRKNVHTIVSAFIQFRKSFGINCKLVIAGKSGGEYRASMVEELTKNALEKEVFFVGYISTEHLCAYYKNAVALVFPSLNEGFGMPVVEAMSLGTPVITSNVSSLPEAAGDAAILVNPHNVDEICQAMEMVFTDTILRETLIKKGYEQAKKFSWTKTANEYLILLEKTVL
ncbi:MAG: glycosyltransferase family 1 protein [Candidatus Kaiserbacteria bacterium]|nr:glycosyltransferase family 1 protein [Candidatus Kaiserbacteria bacterium]